jgi:hypothetical protein
MEMGELWIYWWWTDILEWMYTRQYLWVTLAINVGGKSFSKLRWTHPLTRLNTNQSCDMDNIWLWWECVCH